MSFPEQPFGFVAGRWVRSIGDTPDDPDRAPDYVPVETGTVLFTPQITHRVAPDATGWAGIIKERIPARLGERGQLIDAEGHDHLALAVGVYSVSYDFGSGRSWPSHYIEVRTDHTTSSPLWLPPIAPPAEGPMIENRVVTIPADGRDGQVLVWDGAAFSWDYPPTGPQGPKGDLDAEQLAGAPRLTNRAHNQEWVADSNTTIESQAAGAVKFTATAQNGYIRALGNTMIGGTTYYFTAEVKTTSGQVFFGAPGARAYHSGSGDWERLTGWGTMSATNLLLIRDDRESGWDPIEVRDPVLIDLTAVFGAGREPSKEYMDALMAKHNHYVGGVDQFAFGDALKALTVAGPGLSLRHDTTVGTRVFLDHPGGSTMLYGDTGWRNLYQATGGTATYGTLRDGWAIGSTSGDAAIDIRRINDRILIRIYGIKRATGGGSTFLAPPTGFACRSQVTSLPCNTASTESIVQRRFTSAYSLIVPEMEAGDIFGQANNSVPVVAELLARDSWPASLPGQPGQL